MECEGRIHTEQELIRKRGAIKAKFTTFVKFVNEFDASGEASIHQLRLRIAKMQRDFDSFEPIQNALELVAADESYEQRLIERSEIEEAYLTHVAKAQHLLEICENSRREEPRQSIANAQFITEANAGEHVAQPSGSNNVLPISQSPLTIASEMHVKLPTMHLPKFSGSYEAWPGFADAFRSAVHENPSFRDTQKLIYLRSCLTGKAAEKIESLETTSANYLVAWNILERYYNDPSILINNRIQAIFELPTCTRFNVVSLGELVDNATKHYRALKALNTPFLEAFPIYAIVSKLDEGTRLKWKEQTLGTSLPSMEELLEFLHARRKLVENNRETTNKGTNMSHARPDYKQHGLSRPTRNPNFVHAAFEISCNVCKEKHYTSNCSKLKTVTVSQRLEIVKGAGLCINCLKPNHVAKNCLASSCKQCKGQHHTLLHKELKGEGPGSSTQVNVSALSANVGSETLLSTAIIQILDNEGQLQPCRVLLDSGSQSHFLTEHAARRLGLPRQKINIPVIGINNSTTNIRHTIRTKIQSRVNECQFNITFLILPHITDVLPSRIISKGELKIPKNLALADPTFDRPSAIDGLIGAELFLQLLCVGQVKLANDSITLQKTKLGWVLAGKIPQPDAIQSVRCNVTREIIHEQIAKFWEVEEPLHTPILSEEEREAENHFISNTTRETSTGQYIVKLPFKDTMPMLGESFSVASRRFRSLEQRLAKEPDLKIKYAGFLEEYIRLGHMSEISSTATDDGYYLPHHAVFKQSSLTTKLRVVFDASAKTSNGTSLNDLLLTGPTIQDNLYSLLTRFRFHNYVLTADIEKMYRQILVHPDDRKYQKILWRDSCNEPVKTYVLNTVTYGTSSAPFLAIRSLLQLSLDEGKHFPHGERVLREDFYVDDLLTGASTREEIIAIRDELIKLCDRGNFKLRQWATNDPTLIDTLDDKTNATHLRLDLDNPIKTLGLGWNPKQDTIVYDIRQIETSTRITKRSILSTIASLFDPLGLLGPVIVRAKILMQQLWKLNLNWDESVPADIHTLWVAFCKDLNSVSNITLPRKLTCKTFVSLQLHGFCDASEQAYGACLYTRSVDQHGNVTTQLLSAKSRVAPLKTITLPRLELCAAHLLAKLYQTTVQSLKRIPFDRIIFWSDSTIVLHWIKTPPHKLKTFVAHRVNEIQHIVSNIQWHHTSTSDNPADLISRGLFPTELINNTFWFYGPSWLAKPEGHWPILQLNPVDIPELRPSVALPARIVTWDGFERWSSYNKLKRVIAYVLRFRFNSSRKESNKGSLTASEIHRAELYVIKAIQQEGYRQEIHALNNSGRLDGGIAPLNPFIDEGGILRVGGRLARASIPYNSRHPMLLPRQHHVTRLIIIDQHLKHFHAGILTTLNALRQRFWIPNGKWLTRHLIHKCITCFRAKPPVIQYKMSDLPRSRVTCSKAFNQVGIDFCGPFLIKEKAQRNRNKIKVYLAIFVCFSTKAVHIEIVSDLTTDAVLAALRRFFARRGLPSDIHSDNGTNFIGAKREIKELYAFLKMQTTNDTFATTLANDGINWHTIPPRSPHFGGLWEAAVRRTKHHLTRVVGDTLLSYEAFLTLTNQIEAILNSRPITPLSPDPNDLQALTPSHFLIGENLTNMPDYDYSATPSNKLSSWQHVQQLRRHFWSRWTKDYLQEQITRTKWHTAKPPDIPIGTLVILRKDNTPPMHWPLGRITAIHPGDDGVIRVATVKTSQGEYKRCIKSIAPLPL